MEFDIPGTDVQTVLYDVLNEDRLIRNLLNDQKASQNLARALEDIKKVHEGRQEGGQHKLASVLPLLEKRSSEASLKAPKRSSSRYSR